MLSAMDTAAYERKIAAKYTPMSLSLLRIFRHVIHNATLLLVPAFTRITASTKKPSRPVTSIM